MADKTINQVYDAILEIKQQLLRLNGTVRGNSEDIAVLKERVGQHSINWDRIIVFVLGIMQAIMLYSLLKK
jgi:hypothetical protein